MYIKSTLALSHESRHFVYVGLISGIQVRDTLQMRVQLIPLGGPNWVSVLFFKLRFLFLRTMKNIKILFCGNEHQDLHQMSFGCLTSPSSLWSSALLLLATPFYGNTLVLEDLSVSRHCNIFYHKFVCMSKKYLL